MSTILAVAHQAGYLPKLLHSPLKNLPIYSAKLKTKKLSSSSSRSDMTSKKTYNTPHPPKDPPDNYNPSCVEHEAFEVPDFIPAAVFRSFTSKCETLGPGADKRGCYKNPEYYSYHRYSFAALQRACLEIREQRKKEGNIRCLYGHDNSDDEKFSSDEDKK